MEKVSVTFSTDEVRALLELLENQLFRMRFIDAKVPGHRVDPEKLRVASSAVKTLQDAVKRGRGLTADSVGF